MITIMTERFGNLVSPFPGLLKMTLIGGSLTEQQLREELVRSNVALQDGTGGRLACALESAK